MVITMMISQIVCAMSPNIIKIVNNGVSYALSRMFSKRKAPARLIANSIPKWEVKYIPENM